MKLDRNINEDAKGKYAIIKLRGLPFHNPDVRRALDCLASHGALDWGDKNSPSEFFVIRLKDYYADKALLAYADAAEQHDHEYASEVREMAGRAGPGNKWRKRPD